MMHRNIVLLWLCLLVLPWTTEAARLEISGFESGQNIECQAGNSGSFSFQTTTVYTGTYALEVNPTTSAVGYCALSTIAATGAAAQGGGSGTVYTTFRFRVATLPASANEEIFMAEGSSSVMKLTLRLTSTGALQVYDVALAQLGSDSATTLATGTWYLLGVKVGTGTTAAYEVTVDGASVLSGTGDLSANGHTARYFGKRTNRNSQTMDVFYDDVAVDNAAYPPGHKIVVLHPTANGSTMQWTGGTGASDYTQVDEVLASTTDYVTSTAQNDVALFKFESLPAGTGTTVATVKTMQRLAEVVSGSTLYAVRIRSGSSNSDSSTSDIGTTAYATRSRILETDPATAVAWTTTAVNLVEAGGVDAAIGSRLRLAWITLMVEVSAPVVAPPTGRARMSVY